MLPEEVKTNDRNSTFPAFDLHKEFTFLSFPQLSVSSSLQIQHSIIKYKKLWKIPHHRRFPVLWDPSTDFTTIQTSFGQLSDQKAILNGYLVQGQTGEHQGRSLGQLLLHIVPVRDTQRHSFREDSSTPQTYTSCSMKETGQNQSYQNTNNHKYMFVIILSSLLQRVLSPALWLTKDSESVCLSEPKFS